jgi:Aerotolerance regulator N-terminal/von Willebrand factor type A domain
MRFESFASIGFALSLGAIIVMYLLKRKYVDTVVPSHMLWNRVLRNLEANKPWQKLRNQLLFWIQMLVAALLVFALMEPIIPYDKEVKSHLVIVADTSASMSAADIHDEQGGRISRIEQMKSELREFVSGPAKNSEITLIRMAEQPELIESRQTDSNKLLRSIDQLSINYGINAYSETMSLASSLTRMEKDAEIILYTDEQWPEQSAGITYNVPVRVESITGEGNNVAISQFGVKMASSGDTDKAQGVAVVRNWSKTSQSMDAVLTISDKGDVGEVQSITLEPGTQKTLKFDNLPVASHYSLQLDLDDAVRADNVAYSFLSNQGQRRALLLTEGNLFLEKALQLSGTEVVKIQLPSTDDGTNAVGTVQDKIVVPDTEIDVVILDGVADSLVESEDWGQLLAQHPVWRIGSNGSSPKIEAAIGNFEIKEHPINQYIKLLDTHISQLNDVKSVAWGEPIVKLGDVPVIFAGSEQGQPRLMFNFDLHHSDLPLRAEFPILVRNSIEWLGESQTTSFGRLVAGTTKEIPLSPRAAQAEWKLLESNIDSVSTAQTLKADLTAYQTVPGAPGIYQFEQVDEAGGHISTALAEIVMDSKESNLMQQTKLTFKVSESSQAEGAAENQSSSMSADKQSGVRLAVWLAMLIILLMLIEWEVYQRGNSI